MHSKGLKHDEHDELHWLPVDRRIDYKMCLFAFLRQRLYVYVILSSLLIPLAADATRRPLLPITVTCTSLGAELLDTVRDRVCALSGPTERKSLSVTTICSRVIYKVCQPIFWGQSP